MGLDLSGMWMVQPTNRTKIMGILVSRTVWSWPQPTTTPICNKQNSDSQENYCLCPNNTEQNLKSIVKDKHQFKHHWNGRSFRFVIKKWHTYAAKMIKRELGQLLITQQSHKVSIVLQRKSRTIGNNRTGFEIQHLVTITNEDWNLSNCCDSFWMWFPSRNTETSLLWTACTIWCTELVQQSRTTSHYLVYL